MPTGREHVLPQGFYDRDAEEGYHPLTVPSCRAHNQDYAKLDERMRFFAQVTAGGDDSARLFRGATMRSLTESDGLRKRIMAGAEPATLNEEPSTAIPVDVADHDQFWEKVARALYFHEYNQVFCGSVKHACTHALSPTTDIRSLILFYYSVENDMVFRPTAHPNILRYKIGRVTSPDTGFVLRMTIYNNVTVFVLGLPNGTAWAITE